MTTITRINGNKIKAVNTKSVTFTSEYFKQLSQFCSKAIIAMGQYHPTKMDVSQLRLQFEHFYEFLSHQLQDLYEYDFDSQLMSGLKIESIDLIEGFVHVSIEYPWDLKRVRFGLKVSNDGSPYSTSWPQTRQRLNLIEDKNFAQRLSFV